MSGTERISAAEYKALVGGQPTLPPKSAKERLFALGRLAAGRMNQTETDYAVHLEARRIAGEVAWWRFEGVKLRLADNTFLEIDFPLMLASGELQMHDVKGAAHLATDDARVKLKVAAELYPFQFFLVYPRTRNRAAGWNVERVGPA